MTCSEKNIPQSPCDILRASRYIFPMTTNIFIIAGEPSGDALGAGLMAALPEAFPHPVTMHGIGGTRMEEEGLAPLFPMTDIALMGFAEILPHIPKLMRRIRQTVLAIEALRPDILITIDSPGFCFRVVKQLKKRGLVKPRLVHYVAPSVWAYKPERALKVASLYDMLLVLFPFEPKWFEKVGLPTYFVGHPVMDSPTTPSTPTAGNLVMLPGSRAGELNRHLPLYHQTLALLAPHIPNLSVTLPVPAHWEEYVRTRIHAWPVPVNIISDEQEKKNAFAHASAALVKSGTITLEVAKAGVPMVTTYKVNPLSAWLVRRMIKTKYVNLINILLQREAVPELIQERATPEALSNQLRSLLEDNPARQLQRDAFAEALTQLTPPGGRTASETAARILADT